MRVFLMLCAALSGAGAWAQTGQNDRADLSDFPGMEAAWGWNRNVLRGECVWERKVRLLPTGLHVAEIEAEERAYLTEKGLPESEIGKRLTALRGKVRYDTESLEDVSELRIRWDGARRRTETRDRDGSVRSLHYDDAENYAFIVPTGPGSPHDFGEVYPAQLAPGRRDRLPGKAALLQGEPLRTVLTGVRGGVLSDDGASVRVHLFDAEASDERGKAARMTLSAQTGQVTRIETFAPERPDRVIWRVVPSGVQTYAGNVRMPVRVVATRYIGKWESEVIEYTLRSAKFNDALPPDFLATTPILSRLTRITDYRQSKEGTRYMAEGDLLPVAEARRLRFQNLTREMVPVAILVQVPLIIGIILWRRYKAEAGRS